VRAGDCVFRRFGPGTVLLVLTVLFLIFDLTSLGIVPLLWDGDLTCYWMSFEGVVRSCYITLLEQVVVATAWLFVLILLILLMDGSLLLDGTHMLG
jgi:hypothetical protein